MATVGQERLFKPFSISSFWLCKRNLSLTNEMKNEFTLVLPVWRAENFQLQAPSWSGSFKAWGKNSWLLARDCWLNKSKILHSRNHTLFNFHVRLIRVKTDRAVGKQLSQKLADPFLESNNVFHQELKNFD